MKQKVITIIAIFALILQLGFSNGDVLVFAEDEGSDQTPAIVAGSVKTGK